MTGKMNDILSFFSDGEEKNKTEKGVLYLVATPIGNISDITVRALKVLSEVDFIAAEDTRNSGKLLSLLGISKPFVSYHEHNKREAGDRILKRLKNGEACALITDAGTPAVSDPGNEMCILCAENGVKVTAVPGCCAAIDALCVSALPTRRFAFEGFLPTASKERRRRLSYIRDDDRTCVLYEAPHRIKETLEELLSFLGDRKISLCRELTKLNEEVMRTTLCDAVEYFKEHSPRGEYVIVIAPGEAEKACVPDAKVLFDEVNLLCDSGIPPKEAMKAVGEKYNINKNEVYRAVLEFKKQHG